MKLNMHKVTDQIRIVTAHKGWLTQLRMSGPIYTPLKVPIKTVMELILSGVEIFEVDPKDIKKTIKLTPSNLFDETKFDPPEPVIEPQSEVVPPVEEVKPPEEPPVIEPEVPVEKVRVLTFNEDAQLAMAEVIPGGLAEVDELLSKVDTGEIPVIEAVPVEEVEPVVEDSPIIDGEVVTEEEVPVVEETKKRKRK
jgi:hypothetical protein